MSPSSAAATRPGSSPGGAEPLVASGRFPLADRELDVRCVVDGSDHVLEVAGVGCFRISGEGWTLVESGADLVALREVEEGPVRILSMALGGTFCLHASAVMVGGGAHLILGESGRGKSTLASTLAAGTGPFIRLADDLVPVTLRNGAPVCLPHFHQPQLSTEEQVGAEIPPEIPVAAVWVLEPAEGSKATRIFVDDLSPAAGVAALVRHTVAARLFGRELLRAHLGFCATFAAATPVAAMGYPHRWEAIDRVAALLSAAGSRDLEDRSR